jgi:hypothetical protein
MENSECEVASMLGGNSDVGLLGDMRIDGPDINGGRSANDNAQLKLHIANTLAQQVEKVNQALRARIVELKSAVDGSMRLVDYWKKEYEEEKARRDRSASPLNDAVQSAAEDVRQGPEKKPDTRDLLSRDQALGAKMKEIYRQIASLRTAPVPIRIDLIREKGRGYVSVRDRLFRR